MMFVLSYMHGCRSQEEGLALEPINETWHADVDPERNIQWHAKATSHLDEMIRNLKHEPCGTMGVRRGVPGHGGQWRRCRGDPRAPAPARKEGVPISKARRAPEEPKLTDGSGICGQKQEMAPAATNLWVEGVDGEGARSHLAGSLGRRTNGTGSGGGGLETRRQGKARHGRRSQFSSVRLSSVR